MGEKRPVHILRCTYRQESFHFFYPLGEQIRMDIGHTVTLWSRKLDSNNMYDYYNFVTIFFFFFFFAIYVGRDIKA